MPGRVVVSGGVTRNVGCTEFINVSVAVDADVIGNINPTVLVLVQPLMLAQAARCVAIVTQDGSGVMDGHAGDRVRSAAGFGWPRTPGITAQQITGRHARWRWCYGRRRRRRGRGRAECSRGS